MSERQVRALCPWATCRRGMVTLPDYWGDPGLALCQMCAGTGTILATLADPEAEALLADGEKWRKYWRHGGPTSGSYTVPTPEAPDV